MGTKVKELPGSIQHLPKYVPPAADRIRYSDVWARAMQRWADREPGVNRIFVEIREKP